MRRKPSIVSLVIVLLALASVVASVVYVVGDMRKSNGAIERYRGVYLREMEKLGNAREAAKCQAEREVDRHLETRKADKPKKVRARYRPVKPRGFERVLVRGSARIESTPMPEGDFDEAETEILEVADEAVSDRDLETARDVAGAALKSKDPRVRMRAVEMLGGFGEAGLTELSEFLQDAHPEVAKLAADRFDLGVQDLEDENERVAVAKLGLLSVNDENCLRSLAATLGMANDKLAIIRALTEVIRDGNRAQVTAAKEAYQNETGEEWRSVAAADRWLQRNYEPPEPEEPSVFEQIGLTDEPDDADDDADDASDDGEISGEDS